MNIFGWLDHALTCKWEIRSVQPMLAMLSPVVSAMWGFDNREIKPEPVTQVLQVCKVCGKVQTQTLNGTWTLADLKGELPV